VHLATRDYVADGVGDPSTLISTSGTDGLHDSALQGSEVDSKFQFRDASAPGHSVQTLVGLGEWIELLRRL
jgi:hypothetical protein